MSYLRIKRPYDSYGRPKNRWCRWFGHIRSGYGGGIPYGRIEGGPVDNLNTEHPSVSVTCDRCNEHVLVVRFHRKWEPKK